MTIHLGDWRTALAHVDEVDCIISDPPYSARTHLGNWAGCSDVKDPSLARKGVDDKRSRRRAIGYSAWAEEDAREFVSSWAPRCRGWIVAVTDHTLAPILSSAGEAAGMYTFAPIPFVEIGKCPRMNGDGPASWTCWIVAMRPRAKKFMSWGSLPGAYCFRKGSIEQVKLVVGGKPLRLKQALVKDYSRPGDLVCDPFSGGGTTAIACESLGRRFVGSEIDPDTHRKSIERIAKGVQFDMFAGVA